MVEIKISVEKKHLYFFALLFGIVVGIFIVNAYHATPDWNTNPAVIGHSVDEIDWKPQIQANLSVTGRVGVCGGNSPEELTILEAPKSTDAEIMLNYTGSSGGIPSSYGLGAFSDGMFKIEDYNAGATRMVLDNTGNVGIGVNSPGAKLDVNGNSRITGDLAITGKINLAGVVAVYSCPVQETRYNCENTCVGQLQLAAFCLKAVVYTDGSCGGTNHVNCALRGYLIPA